MLPSVRYFILFILATGLSACGGFAPEPLYGHDDPFAVSEEATEAEPSAPPEPGQKPVPIDPTQKNFETIKTEIFQANCVRCHNPQNAKAGVDMTTLRAIQSKPGLLKWGSPDDSLIYVTILEGSMPPGEFLSDELTEKVKLWIESKPAQ